MMQNIVAWTVSLVAVCVVGGLILFLSPTSSVSKSVKTVVLLCVSLTFLAPIAKCSFDDFLTDDTVTLEDSSNVDLSDQMKSYAIMEAEELVEGFVIESGCEAKEITAVADIDEENSIYITEITIKMSEEYKACRQEINKKIMNVFNIDGEFIWVKE